MPTKKQARAAQRRRQEQLAAKQQARRARRARQAKAGAVVAGASLVVGGIVWGALAMAGSEPGSTPGASPEPTPSAAAAPDPSLAEGREWTATIETNLGPIVVALDGAAAPQAVASFVHLAREGFFDGTSCHRLVTAGIYVLQCGDPTGTGSGGPEYRFGPIENDPADGVYEAGVFAMARQGAPYVGVEQASASMGSQFFIVYEESAIPSDEAGGYTVFGRVVSGLDIVVQVAGAGTDSGATDGAPAQPVILQEVTVA